MRRRICLPLSDCMLVQVRRDLLKMLELLKSASRNMPQQEERETGEE